ncbi:MAG TPA: DUF6209 family protein [Actinomycetota bacterium]|jgi:hypothetical protein
MATVRKEIGIDGGGRGVRSARRPTATVRFESTGEPTLSGELRTGGRLIVDYDPVRLPDCRGSQAGLPAWDITVNARFHPGLQLYGGKLVRQVDASTGRLLIPPAPDPYEVTVPAGAREVELWFQNIDAGGCRAWDSNGGANYWFPVWPGQVQAPTDAVILREGAVVARGVVNVVGEGAVKSNTFPDPAGQGTRLETRLVVVAWVRNDAFAKSVWMDVHVFDPDNRVIEAQTAPLEYAGPSEGGGDLFEFDRVIYLGSVASPGSMSRRPEARKVQYRLYAEMNGELYTDGVLHGHELSEDVTH